MFGTSGRKKFSLVDVLKSRFERFDLYDRGKRPVRNENGRRSDTSMGNLEENSSKCNHGSNEGSMEATIITVDERAFDRPNKEYCKEYYIQFGISSKKKPPVRDSSEEDIFEDCSSEFVTESVEQSPSAYCEKTVAVETKKSYVEEGKGEKDQGKTLSRVYDTGNREDFVRTFNIWNSGTITMKDNKENYEKQTDQRKQSKDSSLHNEETFEKNIDVINIAKGNGNNNDNIEENNAKNIKYSVEERDTENKKDFIEGSSPEYSKCSIDDNATENNKDSITENSKDTDSDNKKKCMEEDNAEYNEDNAKEDSNANVVDSTEESSYETENDKDDEESSDDSNDTNNNNESSSNNNGASCSNGNNSNGSRSSSNNIYELIMGHSLYHPGICYYKAKCLLKDDNTMNKKEKVKVDESEPSYYEEPPFEKRDIIVKRDKWVTDMYAVDSLLGKGKFGEVKKCRERRTGRQLAAKFIEVSGPQDRTDVMNEVEIMKNLQHPRLLQLYDAFEHRERFCLVMELVNGGELFERVINDDFILTEKACVMFMRQICDGVTFMHSQNILHLDMKPENILCLTREGNRIKIIDFGLARKYNPKDDLRVLFGTPEFVAPEVVNFDPICPSTDMWSVGVICYVLLSGLSPFMGESEAETLSNVTMAHWDFSAEEFESISSEAKDFISKLLVKDPRKRLKSSECLEHQWLRRSVKRESHVPERSLSKKRLRKFVYRRKWQKAINAMLALRRMGVSLS